MLGSNPGQLRLRHWLSDALTTRLDLIHTRIDLIHTRLDLIHTRLDLIHTRLDLTLIILGTGEKCTAAYRDIILAQKCRTWRRIER
jgi:hypothetical protein